MILEEALNLLIRNLIDTLLVSPGFTIKAQQNGPRPVNAYADVHFVNEFTDGWEDFKVTNNTGDDDITYTSEGLRQVMFSINFYRDSARDNARRVRDRIVRETSRSTLRLANVGFSRRSEVRSISEKIDGNWEERAQFDLFLNVIGTDSEVVTSILELDIDVTLQSRNTEYTTTIGVS